MEAKTPQPNDQITDKSDEKHCIVAIADAARDALVGEKDEGQVCQRVDDLGTVVCRVVVLERRRQTRLVLDTYIHMNCDKGMAIIDLEK